MEVIFKVDTHVCMPAWQEQEAIHENTTTRAVEARRWRHVRATGWMVKPLPLWGCDGLTNELKNLVFCLGVQDPQGRLERLSASAAEKKRGYMRDFWCLESRGGELQHYSNQPL